MMKVHDPRTESNFPEIAATAVENPPELRCPEIFRGSDEAGSLSFDLRLANEAVRAVAPDEGVRPEAVARARALLASGELGADLERLAERLIDSLVEAHDDRC